MTTARQRFRKGDRVRMTDEAMAHGLNRGTKASGTVVGFGRKPDLVTVLIDGQKTRRAFHLDFWEREHAKAELA